MQKKVVNVQLYIIEQVDPFFIHRSSSRPDRVCIHLPDESVITKKIEVFEDKDRDIQDKKYLCF